MCKRVDRSTICILTDSYIITVLFAFRSRMDRWVCFPNNLTDANLNIFEKFEDTNRLMIGHKSEKHKQNDILRCQTTNCPDILTERRGIMYVSENIWSSKG
jgi:hypothetical protein